MPASRSLASPASRTSEGGILTRIRWIGAPVLAALPIAITLYAGAGLVVEVQRLVLLSVVGVAAALFGVGPGLLAVAIATLSAAYDAVPPGHWLVTGSRDGLLLAAFGACAIVVAVAAGGGRNARLMARQLDQHAARAERDAAERHEAAERAAADVQSLRTSLARRDAALLEAREDTARAERNRRALLESMPPELRAPHVIVPVPLQLFPPIFTVPPVGVPPFTADVSVLTSDVGPMSAEIPPD